MTDSRTGQCDCCGADNVELSFCVAYGIETWSCAEGCERDPSINAGFRRGFATPRGGM
jgi:hypothetical protein